MCLNNYPGKFLVELFLSLPYPVNFTSSVIESIDHCFSFNDAGCVDVNGVL